MAGHPPSLSHAHDLLRELRLGIRRLEVEESGKSIDVKDNDWTTNTIEVR